MKKIIVLIMLFTFILPINTYAVESNSEIVTLSNCVDSESARFILGVLEIKVKFLGIQLEEKEISNDKNEINGKVVSEYVCNLLTNAKQIKIEYEPNIEKEDKFGRIQAWVFVDDVLLQENLIKNGYTRAMYLEDNYLYVEKLKEAQKYAKEYKLGIWKTKEEIESIEKTTKEDKKSKGIIETIIDFIVSIFRKIREFIDGIIKNF